MKIKSVKEARNIVAKVRKVGQEIEWDNLLKWADQAEYMLDTYGNTNHKDEVLSDISRFLTKVGFNF